MPGVVGAAEQDLRNYTMPPHAASEPGVEHGADPPVAQLGPGPVPVVFLRGEVDFSNVVELQRLLHRVSANSRRVVVDMADTTFIDGSVLRVLAQIDARLDGGLKVRGANRFVTRVLTIVEMQHLLIESDPASVEP